MLLLLINVLIHAIRRTVLRPVLFQRPTRPGFVSGAVRRYDPAPRGSFVMSARTQTALFAGEFNRSTQHSISFYLLGFEPRGLAPTASNAKALGCSAAVKPRMNPRRFLTHAVFSLQDRECCVNRLNRPVKQLVRVARGTSFARSN